MDVGHFGEELGELPPCVFAMVLLEICLPPGKLISPSSHRFWVRKVPQVRKLGKNSDFLMGDYFQPPNHTSLISFICAFEQYPVGNHLFFPDGYHDLLNTFITLQLRPDSYHNNYLCLSLIIKPCHLISIVLRLHYPHCYQWGQFCNVISYHWPWLAMEFPSNVGASLIRAPLIALGNGVLCDHPPLP